ncbi:MAG: LicD family protein, partial [Candidatus Cloacimonetes bacterium]|nr:LicD family protein [Candidatus Cloacimonadota bacterium]
MSGTTKLTGKKLRIALKMLDRVTSFLENNKIPYLLEGGTLLGIIREQRLLPWDNDIDLTLIEQFKPLLLKNIWKLRLMGLRVKVKRYQREIGPFKLGETRIVKIRNYRLLFFRGDVMIDLFIKRRIGDRYFWT